MDRLYCNTQTNVFRNEMENMKEFLYDVTSLMHSTQMLNKTRKQPICPYEPSYFLYVFFLFNTLYNIDWVNSSQFQYEEMSNTNERNKIKKLISFCFNNKYFYDGYKNTFTEIVCSKYSKEKIQEMMEKIDSESIMNSISKDKNEDKVTKEDFTDACKSLLFKDSFQEDIIEKIALFIYKIRCNIVHGEKSMNELKDDGQRHRIEVYALFLIAIMHMAFSHLDFMCCGNYSSDVIKKRLEIYSTASSNLHR